MNIKLTINKCTNISKHKTLNIENTFHIKNKTNNWICKRNPTSDLRKKYYAYNTRSQKIGEVGQMWLVFKIFKGKY